MIEMIFSDVDDTLIEKKITKNTVETIKDVLLSGIEFVLASGRPTGNLIKTADKINEQGGKLKYLCGFNGAEIYDIEEKKLIYQNGFNVEEVDKILQELDEYKIDYVLYEGDIVFSNNINNEYSILEAELNNFNIKPLNEKIPTSKILGLVDPNSIDKKINILKEIFPELMIVKSKPFFIEITKNAVSKGNGLKKISTILNVNYKENVAIFGDSNNDLSMFEMDIKYKYAVGNATDIIKENATEIIGKCNEEGAAKKMKEIIG